MSGGKGNPIDEEGDRADEDGLFDPLGRRDLGVEGGEAADRAVLDPDPVEMMERKGEPGPLFDQDPDTEGDVEELLDEARTVELEELDVDVDVDLDPL